MAEQTPHDLELPGCTPEPLMAYLKAIGILRLVSEQKDPDARGWWRNDVFWLKSTLDGSALVRFFLEDYKPTPLFSPWNGDGGFLSDSGTSVETINWFKEDKNPRFQAIRDAITAVEQIPLMLEFRQKRDRAKELDKNKKGRAITGAERDELSAVTSRVKQIKQTVVTSIRGGFPDSSLEWLDCCLTIGLDGFTASPLLGSGGVDGRLDFGNNFLVNCRAALAKPEPMKPLLAHALHGEAATLEESSIGQFSPGQIGAPNSTQGFEGVSLINPWDFILMMEGALILAGAAVRRYGIVNSAKAAFPFTVRSVAAGFDSPASKDEADSRGEIWLPIWNRPTSAGELRQLFGEGRAEVSGRTARNGVDFARAVSSLGVDRGIAGFSRLGFLKRSGKAFLAAPLGRFEVVQRTSVDLIRQIDSWLDRYRSACSADAPARFTRALRTIDTAIFDFCRYGGKLFFQRILIALGRAERELALTPGKFGHSRWPPGPLAGLSHAWIDPADDGSPECAVALAIASVHDPAQKIGPLRTNLEPVDWQKRCRAWAEKNPCAVWNRADLATNLANVLQRRMMDGDRAGCEHLPLASRHIAPLSAVSAFIAGKLDDERVEELIWGLMLVDRHIGSSRATIQAPNATEASWLPREYALLKLLFLARALAPERRDVKLRWRLARNGESGITIRPEPRILPLLRAGRVGEACRIASQRLRVSGLPPMPGPLSTGMMRDAAWAERVIDHSSAQRLAAALLIPISSAAINRLIHLVCREQSAAAETLAPAGKGVME